MTEEEPFQYLDPRRIDWQNRFCMAFWSDVAMFSTDETSLPTLIRKINEYNSDWNRPCQGSGNALNLLTTFLERAIECSVRNTELLLASWRFFQTPIVFSMASLKEGVKIQTLDTIKVIVTEIERSYDQTKKVRIRGDEDLYRLIGKNARLNPDVRVAAFMKYFNTTPTLSQRKQRIAQWDQLEMASDVLAGLETCADCYLFFLPRDIRTYLIKPYLDNYYLGV